MRIHFSPQRRDDALILEKSAGNHLRFNGELFNFNALEPGDTIPAGVVPCDWIVGPIEHIDGHITLTVILPHGADPEAWQAFPAPIETDDDGPIDVPVNTVVNVAEIAAAGGTRVVTTVRRWHQPDAVSEQFVPHPVPEPESEPEPEPDAMVEEEEIVDVEP